MSRWFVALLIVFPLLCGCRSGGAPMEKLPFHVAIVPLTVEPMGPAAAPGVPYELEGSALSTEIASTLEGSCFSVTTMLRPPEGVTLDELRAWPVAEQDAHWLAACEDVGADLLLEGAASYVPSAEGSTNERFWLNLPVFLLVGPVSWFIPDRKYVGDARVRCTVRDINSALAGTAELGSPSSRLASAEATVERVDLDFISRAGAAPPPYLLSIFVPPGVLARSGASVERELGRQVQRGLASGLAAAVDRVSSEIVTAADRYDFYLESLAVDPAGDRPRLVGRVVLREDRARNLTGFLVEVDGVSACRGTFGGGSIYPGRSGPRSRYLVFRLSAPLPSSGELVRVTVIGGGRAARRRTYTARLSDLAVESDPLTTPREESVSSR